MSSFRSHLLSLRNSSSCQIRREGRSKSRQLFLPPTAANAEAFGHTRHSPFDRPHSRCACWKLLILTFLCASLRSASKFPRLIISPEAQRSTRELEGGRKRYGHGKFFLGFVSTFSKSMGRTATVTYSARGPPDWWADEVNRPRLARSDSSKTRVKRFENIRRVSPSDRVPRVAAAAADVTEPGKCYKRPERKVPFQLKLVGEKEKIR